MLRLHQFAKLTERCLTLQSSGQNGIARIDSFIQVRDGTDASDSALRILDGCGHKWISVITPADPKYSVRFDDLPDMPVVLYVLGSGADICYPKEHEKLYSEIILSGCLGGLTPKFDIFSGHRGRRVAGNVKMLRHFAFPFCFVKGYKSVHIEVSPCQELKMRGSVKDREVFSFGKNNN